MSTYYFICNKSLLFILLLFKNNFISHDYPRNNILSMYNNRAEWLKWMLCFKVLPHFPGACHQVSLNLNL